MTINKNLINPGKIHWVGQLGINPNTGQSGTFFSAIYIESIETVGGTVYLGVRDFEKFTLSQDKTEVVSCELYDTVQYVMLNTFSSIQTYENYVNYLKERKKFNDKKKQEELNLSKQQEANNERHDDTLIESGPGTGGSDVSADEIADR